MVQRCARLAATVQGGAVMAGHGRLPSIPWSRINDFLLRVCAAQNLEEFNALVCAHVSALIPHDFPILCIAPKREDLVGFGTTHPEELVDPGIRAIAGDPGTVADFNRHFRFHLPIPIGYFLARVVTDFRPFTATELVTDFIRPRKVERCLGSWFHHYTIVIPRCKPSRPFDDKDIAVSRIISAHLDNFYSILSLSSLSCRAKAHELPLPSLTPREQEIANRGKARRKNLCEAWNQEETGNGRAPAHVPTLLHLHLRQIT